MKKFYGMIIPAVVVYVICMSLCGCAAAGYTVFPGEFGFSDDILFSARILGGRAEYAHRRMTEVIRDIDAQVSLTRKDSDISRFNNSAVSERVTVGKYAYELFMLSREYYELTDGAFNCASAALTELWKVDAQSLAGASGEIKHMQLPTEEEVGRIAEYCDPRNVIAECTNGAYYLTKTDERVRLDFGGIAKGYAVDKCAEILNEYDISSAMLEISGNVYFYGRYVDGDKNGDWNVGVVAPRPRGGETLAREYVCAFVSGGNESAVTSGDYMRYYANENPDGSKVYIPHIIDRSGIPAGVRSVDGIWRNTEEWVISATVIGASSALCDALSTAVVALGPERGCALLKKVGYKGLIFTEKRFTIIGNVQLYKPDEYNGYRSYEYCEL